MHYRERNFHTMSLFGIPKLKKALKTTRNAIKVFENKYTGDKRRRSEQNPKAFHLRKLLKIITLTK